MLPALAYRTPQNFKLFGNGGSRSRATFPLGFDRTRTVGLEYSNETAAVTLSDEASCNAEGPKTYQDHQEGKTGFSQKVIWPPMALKIGLPGSSALQNDGHLKPVILQCRTPRKPILRAIGGQIYFLIKSLFFSLPSVLTSPLWGVALCKPGIAVQSAFVVREWPRSS